ncbi:MAG: glucoamylase family protein [Gemmatimonadota bacterium]
MSNGSAATAPGGTSDSAPSASEAADDLIAGPVRGELLGADQLAERARSVAKQERLRQGRRLWRPAPLLARLIETRKILDAAHRRLTAAAERTEVGPAGDWFLDNYHVVQEHIREVRASLPGSYYRELPELAAGRLSGFPRVYEIAITLISHTEGRIDLENTDLVAGAFQQVSPLRIGELWAIPAMLRLGLIENVRRMTLRTVQRLDDVERADRIAAALLAAAEEGSKTLGNALVQLTDSKIPLNAAFIARFLQQLRLAPASFAPLGWLEQWIAGQGMSGEVAASQATHRLAITQIMMANSITSLRSIARMDWRVFVEKQSALDAQLRLDPSGYYPRMTFATRDHYRHVVERVALRTKGDEAAVARVATDLAAEHARSDGREAHRAHVGYFLIDAGLPDLEARTGYRPGVREAMHRAVLRHPDAVFFGTALLGTLVALALLLRLGEPHAYDAWVTVTLLGLIPSSDIAISMTNRLIIAFLPPRILPKLDVREGVPPEFRTAVVIPTLFGSVDAVAEALETIEVQFLANREAHLHFAILSDFTDADAEAKDSDAAIVAAAVDGVRALNARYAPKSEDAFYLFHRPRLWNPAQGAWMGWERKRGKLSQFNHFVRGQAHDVYSTIVGNVDALRGIRYVITLDSDTVLPPDAAALLVGTLAHPLNRAVYDPARGRVVRGYGILQPRVGISLPSAHRSVFASLQSGQPGVDPYTTAVSDVYQDLYGEGSFTGKGIYDVDAFEQATRGRFPENRLLSHDLIEGTYARAGLVTDITVYDDYPAQYLTYTRRKHRWLRGDWQLLQWLTARVPGPDGPERNRLGKLSRWKIFDNLRRSVVEISLMVFLAASWWILPGSPVRWTVLALLALASPWIISLLLAVLRPPLDKSWRAFYAGIARDAVTSVNQVALTVIFLPHQAWISLDGIVRTLWRLAVSQRRLLEWQTASQTEQRMVRGVRAWRRPWRAMWPVSLLALMGLTFGPLTAGTYALIPLFLLWAASPAIAHALSAPARRRAWRMPDVTRAGALRYARLHWRFYERFVTEETHWLAPDNFQEDPVPVVAMRTSPTNIGLQLLSTVSAHDLGFITTHDMVHRLELTIRTLEQMRRFHGHFFNWYDLRDLKVLEPPYISTVDSGNFAGHLLALRQACLGIKGAVAAELSSRLQVIADRAADFANEMDFSFLYDESRELFAIGYQQASHTLDVSFYDLLASEARLASFLAIARNDVPVDHWFHLGRTLTRASGDTALVSWSGTMFEYLMPTLVMQVFPLTLLDQTYRSAVKRQMAYGADHGVPWGTSESAYNLRDRHATYQYRAFGVPQLALERRIGQDLVVAPYATALALAVAPRRAFANLAALEAKGALGDFGFYDALDYTRPEPGKRYAIVRNYMAHHVGMSLVALTNALMGDIWPRRFHAEPLVRAAELLLHERIPRKLVFHKARQPRPADALPDPALEHPVVRELDVADTPRPHIALLGRLPYTVMVSHCGGGYSRYRDLDVTRWRADGTTDNTGQFCYVKDVHAGHVWSATHQPVCAPGEWYHAFLAADRATFHRRDHGIETRTEVAVVPDDAAEVRRVTLTNDSDTARELEVTSYGEVVLAAPGADRQHPAFSNLFVETEWHAWCAAITATRRPRSAKEARLWCAHVVDGGGSERVGRTSFETDRARFVGRGRSPRAPHALDHDGALPGSIGAVLDPIFAIRVRVRLAPGQSASVAFTTLVADSAKRAFALADRYHDSSTAQRALDLAWTATQVELRELGVSPADASVFQELAGHLFYSHPGLRAPDAEVRANTGSQPLLWSHGISGDWPILLARIRSEDGIPTIAQLFAAHHYWRRRGMMVDLVVLNEQPSGYLQVLHDRITAAMFAASDSAVVEQPGGVFIRQSDQLGEADLRMLRATARVIVECDGRSLAHIAEVWRGAEIAEEVPAPPARSRASGRRLEVPEEVHRVRKVVGRHSLATPRIPVFLEAHDGLEGEGQAPAAALRFDNGTGGLTANNDYDIRVQGDALPPAPWANVIANARGGFLVTERGAGCTWAGNAQFYRLTPWHNDPVSDPPSDVLYLRDEETGELWSPTPAPIPGTSPYTIRHSAGSSVFRHHHVGIETLLTLGMAPDDPVRLSLLRVTNREDRTRRVSVTSYAEWTLGAQREHTRHQVITSFDDTLEAHIAWNTFNPTFAATRAFAAMSEPLTSHTGDRREFLGRNGSLRSPAALVDRATVPLSGRTSAGLDSCAALQCTLVLAPGEAREIVVVLGAADNDALATASITRYRDLGRARDALSDAVEGWTRRLSQITVRTPEPSFDVMLNRWSLYQALACRMWGRAGVYQSSGAFGFRDQLQDVMAFVYAEPMLAREHIVRAAGRQFVEGDVQHWWHPPDGRGVRTRFSDDLAWLPFVVEHYVRVTGDRAVLDEPVGFITMPPLRDDEHEVYDLPQPSSDPPVSVYQHCLLALRRACTTGAHGLPLIGTGDWNDGMNRVGAEGRGESVWLAWFLTATLRAFANVAVDRGDEHTALAFRERAVAYAAAVEQHAWDGEWYRRAWFDDGAMLGSSQNEECRIDSIAQSWSVISGAGDPGRQRLAMQSLEKHLVHRREGIIQLLTPPFDKSPVDPGYIKGYLPGVRENGAQYTHAALWAVQATALLGDGGGDRAFELYQMINPLMKARSAASVATYKVEPYVVAADVYTAEGQLGRGGWTWYTGSASWMYRVGLETILGFTKRGDTLRIEPRVPASWTEYAIEYRFGTSTYAISVRVAARDVGASVTVDGQALEGAEIPLVSDGRRHDVVIIARNP